VNNREKATLIWLGIALATALANREFRWPLWEVGKAFASPKILGALLALAGWTVGLVALADVVGLWNVDQRNDTVTWFITVGVALYFSLDMVKEDGFFSKATRRAVAATVFVEGFVNLAQLPLLGESLLLPLVTFLVLLAAVSEANEEHALVYRLVNRVLIAVGAGLAAYVAVRQVVNFDAAKTGRSLALPVWLTLGTMPLIYVVGLWSAYQQAFGYIDLRTDDPAQRRRAKRALLRAAHVRAAEVGGFTRHWIWDLASVESSEDARAVMWRWRKTWRAERHAERTEDARAYMEEWLTQDSPTLAEIHADTLRRSWERLDGEQRATLKEEGLRLAPRVLADDLRALPD
jgi:hypothetical protein